MIAFVDLGRKGRLGNRLFQMAATIALAVRNNDDYMFPIWPYEKFFNLHNCFSNTINTTVNYTEPSFTYTSIPYKPNTNIIGYFQSEKYFDDCKDIIHSLLTPNIHHGIKYGHTSIHVRRGDYTQLRQQYTQLNMGYYQAAMNRIKSPKYIVFSDDIQWCKTQFKGDRFIFSEGTSEVEDLALMLACENNIIANSSFSWWGAWLNKNPSKIVVAPQKWFGPAMPHDTKDLCPESWALK